MIPSPSTISILFRESKFPNVLRLVERVLTVIFYGDLVTKSKVYLIVLISTFKLVNTEILCLLLFEKP
jgi:hypothetical protein